MDRLILSTDGVTYPSDEVGEGYYCRVERRDARGVMKLYARVYSDSGREARSLARRLIADVGAAERGRIEQERKSQ
jgi:hypothetical protein